MIFNTKGEVLAIVVRHMKYSVHTKTVQHGATCDGYVSFVFGHERAVEIDGRADVCHFCCYCKSWPS